MMAPLFFVSFFVFRASSTATIIAFRDPVHPLGVLRRLCCSSCYCGCGGGTATIDTTTVVAASEEAAEGTAPPGGGATPSIWDSMRSHITRREASKPAALSSASSFSS